MMADIVNDVTLQDIQQARERIAGSVRRTPLIPLNLRELKDESRKVIDFVYSPL